MKKKHLMIGLITAGFFASCNTPSTTDAPTSETDSTEVVVEETEEEEETTIDPNQTSFGPNKVDTTIAISTEELLAQFEGKTELEATFKAEINETSSKMGCWINIAKEDGETFRVRFKEHYTIPDDTAPGTIAYMAGKAIQDTLAVDMQKPDVECDNASHEQSDAVTEGKYEMSFNADGIEIVK